MPQRRHSEGRSGRGQLASSFLSGQAITRSNGAAEPTTGYKRNRRGVHDHDVPGGRSKPLLASRRRQSESRLCAADLERSRRRRRLAYRCPNGRSSRASRACRRVRPALWRRSPSGSIRFALRLLGQGEKPLGSVAPWPMRRALCPAPWFRGQGEDHSVRLCGSVAKEKRTRSGPVRG